MDFPYKNFKCTIRRSFAKTKTGKQILTEQVTNQTEEFLESVYRLQERDGAARTSELVKMLNVVPGTVTNTVERLEKRGLLTHEAYKGVKLTEEGRNIAVQVIRRHRLSERLLSDVLKMEWSRVHEAACELEHGITEEVAKKIEKILEWPETCPHGNPIPTRCGGIATVETQPLLTLKPSEEATVNSITDESRSTLRLLEKAGIKPKARIRLVKKHPNEKAVTVGTKRNTVKISMRLAQAVKVSKTKKHLGPKKAKIKTDQNLQAVMAD
jgi:DtxR family Mn-dependent transcriptional regulator